MKLLIINKPDYDIELGEKEGYIKLRNLNEAYSFLILDERLRQIYKDIFHKTIESSMYKNDSRNGYRDLILDYFEKHYKYGEKIEISVDFACALSEAIYKRRSNEIAKDINGGDYE